MELVEDFPSRIAQMLIDGEVDMGLVPVATIPHLKEWHIVSDAVIAATGDVASVCLFSQVPVAEVDTVLLDYQSRTSVNLCKVLMRYHWKKEVKFIATGGEFADKIAGTTAGVIIGDRALLQRGNFPYIYDFAREWRALTGLPFVFAAWIANKKLPEEFVREFNEANKIGQNHLAEIIAEYDFPAYDLHQYFSENIDYQLTDDMRKGLELFLDYLKKLNEK